MMQGVMRLKDKVAIITGIGAGIGEATSILFAQQGARLVLNDIDEANGKRVLKLVKKAGGKAVLVLGDVSLEETAKKLVAAAVKNFKKLDILVNNAANFTQMGVEQAEMKDWLKVFGVNVFGPAMLCKHAIPELKKVGKGAAIVNVASMSGVIAQQNFTTYNASKGAVLQMTRCMALDLAPFGVRVNSVCPGCVDTSATRREAARLGMPYEVWTENAAVKHMLNRIGEPIEVANPILFMASDESSFMTAATIMVDGGYTEW
jgi:NAD(P)-dependent dehydrogenase (short-subunit alcohol dehydrogenase family)